MSATPALQVSGLTTRFNTPHGSITAVDGVSFSVARGETLGLVGESGSGKSVTAMSILRLIAPPGRIVEGSVCLNGTELLSLDDEQMRQRRGTEVGMVFQNPMTALNPVYSIGWQMREALRAHQFKGDPDARIREALQAVGMPDPDRQAAAFAHQMSGGMRQRVVIAMGMLHHPPLLIADEPTTALDVTIQAQVLALMKRLTQDRGTALLLITHNMGVIARMCDRVAVMYAGEIVEEAGVDDLFNHPSHPYTQGLLRSIPRANQGRGKLPSLAGAPPDLSKPIVGCRFRERCDRAVDACKRHPLLQEIDANHRVRCWVAQAPNTETAAERAIEH